MQGHEIGGSKLILIMFIKKKKININHDNN